MKNKNRIRLLAMATAAAVLTTAIPPQGMVYASEPVGTEAALDDTAVTEESSEMPSKTGEDGTRTETSEDSKKNTETETSEDSEESTETESLEESTETKSLEDSEEGTETESLEESTETESLEDGEESTETESLEESTETEQSSENPHADMPELEAEDDIKNLSPSNTIGKGADAGEIPQKGDIVKKHTVNVEKDNPENENTDGKDTYWQLVWSDEFNSDHLDETKWGYQVGNGSAYGVAGWGNNELEYYTDGENVSFTDDGQLVITAKKESKYGSDWTSAKLWTKGQAYYDGEASEPLFAKKYGRIEAKMTLPAGTGLWPAFWMMPLDDVYGGWASSGEIDIMEARGRLTNSIDGTIHFGNVSPNNKSRGGHYDGEKTISEAAANFDFTGEHEYAVEWLPGQMKWYVDDECYFTTSNWYATSEGNGDHFTYPAPFDQDFFIMLNLAVGGNYDGGALDSSMTEASMYVDYVRVYDLCDDAAGTVHDYAADEQKVSSTSASGAAGGLEGGKNIGDNYLTGNLKEAHASVADQDEIATSGDTPKNTGWYLLTGTNGAATVNGLEEDGAGEGGVAKVDISAPGDNTYSVQFSHQLPLTQGYAYKLQFDAKADKGKNITVQMSDYVYTAFDGTWDKYSDLKTIALSTDWKTYEFEFNMTELTDKDTRLEINLGANGTDSVYFRNATLVATGIYEGESEDADKTPLSTGEHIYNGTFDQGNNKNEADDTYTRMRFWDLIGGAAGSVANDRARSLTLSPGTDAEAGIEQKNVQLLANEDYKLTFDAVGSRDVTVKIVGNDGTVYHTETVNAAKGQVINFTVPKTVSGDYGKVQFLVGNSGGAVTLDNISMIRETNKSVDWASLPFYPMGNYDFSLGGEGWNVFNDGPPYGWVNNGTADSGDPNAYHLDIVEKGLHIVAAIPQSGSAWCVGIQTEGINAVNVTALINYKLRLKITDVSLKAEGSVKDKKTISIQMPDGTTETCTITPGDNDEIVIPFTSKSNIEGGQILIQLGANSATEYGQYDFILEYMDFAVDVENNDKNGIPEEYKKLRAPEISSVGGVEQGKSVVIQHSDNKWAANITKVYVNETEIDLSKISTASGRVMIAADVFPTTGIYTIRFEADGYLDGEAVTQEIFEALQGDIVTNGTFDSGIDGWGSAWSEGGPTWDGSAIVSAVDGEAVISIDGPGYDGGNCVSWSHQFKQSDIAISRTGNYILTFDAYATKERPIQLEFKNLGTASQNVVNLTTEKTTYAILLSGVPVTNEGTVNFMMGNVNGCLEDFSSIGAHKIHLDNVSLQAWSQEAQDELVAPELSVKSTPVVGEDLVFGYALENPAWEVKTITVAIDGKAAASDKVLKDTDANTITIDGSVFTAAKRYTITVAAEGYNKQTFELYVAADKSNLLPDEFYVAYDGSGEGETGSITTKSYGFDVVFDKTLPTAWEGVWMFWSMQAKIDNIQTLAKKSYILAFDAELTYTDPAVTEARDLVVEFGNSANQETVSLKTGKHHYECEVLPGANDAFYILFMAGGTKEDVAAHTLDVSNIEFAEKGEIVNVTEPVIMTQPLGASYTVGDAAAALTVAAESQDGGSISYQWYKNNIDSAIGAELISGANRSSYTPDTSATGTVYYFCEVTNTLNTGSSQKAASVNSSMAAIVVNGKNSPSGGQTAAQPVITTQPVGATYTAGDAAAALTVAAKSADGGSLSYQWYKNSKNSTAGATAIAGATKASYTPATSAAGTTYYFCAVTNAKSSTVKATVNSNMAAVVVNAKTGAANSGTTVSVTGITLNKKTLTLNKGKTATLKATVAPANAANKKLTWKSSKTKVATVDQNGKVKAVGKGTTTITVTTADGNKKATCKVTVKIPSKKVKLNTKKVYVVKGKSVSVKATLTPTTSTDKITWSSSNKKVATVKNGKITAKKVGKATITAKTTSGKKATLKVYVVKKATKSTSIKLNKKTLSIKKGATYNLVATVKPATSTDIVKWKSSNKKVATVDAFGTVTGKKKGKATITATTTSGKKYTCKVTVK